ncbi:hypothetical protein FZX15_12935 [Brucella suis bv. 1]|nr:hypothetical protein FZX15_12935 [Brucella suis bv. 1]
MRLPFCRRMESGCPFGEYKGRFRLLNLCIALPKTDSGFRTDALANLTWRRKNRQAFQALCTMMQPMKRPEKISGHLRFIFSR